MAGNAARRRKPLRMAAPDQGEQGAGHGESIASKHTVGHGVAIASNQLHACSAERISAIW
jgi:hypothetical protein